MSKTKDVKLKISNRKKKEKKSEYTVDEIYVLRNQKLHQNNQKSAFISFTQTSVCFNERNLIPPFGMATWHFTNCYFQHNNEG